ncbi:MAG: 3'-5' exonuclease [Thermotaleaceae bacterium]
MSQEIIQVVKDKLYFITKETLINFVSKKGLVDKTNITKDTAMEAISNVLNEELAYELIETFKSIIGFNYYEIEQKLNITKAERKKWTKKGYLNVVGTYSSKRAYGKYLDCPIYDPRQIISLTAADIQRWRLEAKPLTENQRQGIEKAKATSIKNRTCIVCGDIVQHKNLLKDGWCDDCLSREHAYERRRFWLEHKDNYVILDNETTGLEDYDEIVEIAIIDLNDNVLLNTFVMPTVNISEEAESVHGISHERLVKENAPGWETIYPMVKEILENKTVLAYNAEFDARMIRQSCKAVGIKSASIKYECLMQNVMLAWNTDQYVSLKHAAGENYQDHRALGDCRLCLDIISRNEIHRRVSND